MFYLFPIYSYTSNDTFVIIKNWENIERIFTEHKTKCFSKCTFVFITTLFTNFNGHFANKLASFVGQVISKEVKINHLIETLLSDGSDGKSTIIFLDGLAVRYELVAICSICSRRNNKDKVNIATEKECVMQCTNVGSIFIYGERLGICISDDRKCHCQKEVSVHRTWF